MLDFVIDMGMDWWKPYYVDVDYQEKTVRFQFPGEVVWEWKANGAMPKGKFICNL